MFGSGIGLDLIVSPSGLILQEDAFPEQPYGDCAHSAAPDPRCRDAGVELTRPVMPEVFAEIDAAFSRYGILVFRSAIAPAALTWNTMSVERFLSVGRW
jgi:hypothetical protein